MRIQEPDKGKWMQLFFTGASVALTYCAADMIKSADAVELLCRDKWARDCFSNMEGTWRWCAKASLNGDICPKEAHTSMMCQYLGFAAIGLMLGSMTRLTFNIFKVMNPRRVHQE